MSDIAIRVEGLGKRYRIGARRERYKALRDTIADAARWPVRAARSLFSRSGGGAAAKDTIWALKDVSFEVQRGDVVGVIGRNGAGKSTLLKILSRITEPTEGRVGIHGRVGSLLEVGSGFHPELTGRENVYLNGAILGMKRTEIECKFDEIVAFAEIEKFLDTPVKHYSSGMYMRLAFAVAAHLDPEVLLVDEVLAVGDAVFQRKCLGKMGEVAKGGRTVLFVSHQMNAIRRLCETCLWLDCGRLLLNGPTTDIVGRYEAGLLPEGHHSSDVRQTHADRPAFTAWRIVEPISQRPNVLRSRGPFKVSFAVHLPEPVRDGHHGIALYSQDARLLWGNAVDGLRLGAGCSLLTHKLEDLPLKPGVYWWRVSLYEGGKLLDVWDCTPPLEIATMPVAHRVDQWAGLLNVASSIRIERATSAQDLAWSERPGSG